MRQIHIQIISKKLKNLREEKKITQEELAEQLGISRQSIISVEHGKCIPSLPVAMGIAQIFDLSLEDLFLEKNISPLKGDEKMPFGDLDRFFDDEEQQPAWPRWKFSFPTVNVSQTDKEVWLFADIPGIKEDELQVEVGDDFVEISGRRQEEEKKEDEDYFRQEIRYGSFARHVLLPTKVSADQSEATIQDGMLKLIMPRIESTKTKVTKIKVKKA